MIQINKTQQGNANQEYSKAGTNRNYRNIQPNTNKQPAKKKNNKNKYFNCQKLEYQTKKYKQPKKEKNIIQISILDLLSNKEKPKKVTKLLLILKEQISSKKKKTISQEQNKIEILENYQKI